jgi:glycosyltransferase involved in cell wall biosynthesis
LKLHAYIICYNEEKIIKSILEYYSSICSKIFIYDNLSNDSTVEIAKTFEKVSVNYFDTDGMKDNSLHVKIKTEEYKKYSRKGGKHTTEVADWIICIDTDEVIYHPDIINVLAMYKEKGVTVPSITGFNMVGENDIVSDTPIIEQYPSGVREPVFDKCAVFDADFDMSYTSGCHSYGAGFELMKQTYGYKSSNQIPIALLHYKHIGSLLYESAIKNLDRFNQDDITLNNEGVYKGPGSHYAFYKERGGQVSPLLKRSRNIFDEKINILFNNFSSASGDLGTKDFASQKIDKSEVNTIRDAGLKMELINPTLALSLMRIALKLRPSGPVIKRKILELEALLKG